jgi:hypothetical protein
MNLKTLLRRMFGPRMEEGAGGWRSLQIEELHNYYVLPSIIMAIKPRKMRWVGRAERMKAVRNS